MPGLWDLKIQPNRNLFTLLTLYDISIPLKPSKKAIVLFGSLYGLSMLCVGFSDIPNVLKLLCIGAILWDAYRVFSESILLCSKKAIISIEYKNKKWFLNTEQKAVSVHLLVLQSQLLRFKYSRNSSSEKTLYLFKDSMQPEFFHQLLLLARLQKQSS